MYRYLNIWKCIKTVLTHCDGVYRFKVGHSGTSEQRFHKLKSTVSFSNTVLNNTCCVGNTTCSANSYVAKDEFQKPRYCFGRWILGE